MITLARLHEALAYNPSTGVFTWRIPTRRVPSGSVAGTVRRGYRFISVDRHRTGASRWAWFYMTGKWPRHEIDHIDLNGLNNAWSNLREATSLQNKANVGARKNNKSGYKGVHFHSQSGKWRAMLRVNGKSRHLGLFDDATAAQRAYYDAAFKAFGAFARQA